MKHRAFSMTLLFALALALGSAAFVSQKASAACYDSLKNPVPCPQQPNDKKKKPTPTDVPATPTATATKEPSSQSIVVGTPDASQSAELCASLPAVQGANGGSNLTNATGPGGGPGAPAPVTPPNTAGFSGFELGAGGLLVGVLIGLLLPAVLKGGLLPAVSRGYTGDGNFTGPITSPGDDKFTGGVFDKRGEAGLNYSKRGEAGFEEWAQGGSSTGQGEAAAVVDMFQKGSPFIKIEGESANKLGGAFEKPDAGLNFDKDAKTGYLKQGGAGMGDGSVHNMDNQFQKRSDAHITVGTSLNGDG
jgi:hypothetical protein